MLPDDCAECPNCGTPYYGTLVECSACGYSEWADDTDACDGCDPGDCQCSVGRKEG